MTQAIKNHQIKISRYFLYSYKNNRFTYRKAIKNNKKPPAVNVSRGNLFKKLYDEEWIDWKNPNLPGDNTPFRFTGKEMDQETGLYYYGARYLDPKTSRWLSGDPAMGEYVPSAGQDASKLSGMGGVYNTVNLHTYHYAANNPVRYVDPMGRDIEWVRGEGVTEEQMAQIVSEAGKIMNRETAYGRRLKELNYNKGVTVTINVNSNGESNADAENWNNATNGVGSNSIININMNDFENYKNESVAKNWRATLIHEVAGHAYDYYKGTSPYNGETGEGGWTGLLNLEMTAVGMENEYRSSTGLPQRTLYDRMHMPIYNNQQKTWYRKLGYFNNNEYYDFSTGFTSLPLIEWRPK